MNDGRWRHTILLHHVLARFQQDFRKFHSSTAYDPCTFIMMLSFTFAVAMISAETWIPVAIFFAITASVLWLANLRGDDAEVSMEDRLNNLRTRRGSRGSDPDQKSDPRAKRKSKNDRIAAVLERVTSPIAESVQNSDSKNMSDLAIRLVQAGYRRENSPVVFKSLQMLLGGFGLFLGGIIGLIFNGISNDLLIKVVVAGGLGYYLPEFILMWQLAKRRQSIFLGLPDALDLMVVCVEAGLGLDQAMRKVGEELGKSHPVVAEEFNIANHQLQLGSPRAQVLQALGTRNGVDDLQQLASILIQADKFGSSVGQALRVQSETMRTQRMQIAEEKASKTAVKMLFPMVIFIFPGIFVVLVGPAAISIIRNFN
jgi:tight adherence protein C